MGGFLESYNIKGGDRLWILCLLEWVSTGICRETRSYTPKSVTILRDEDYGKMGMYDMRLCL